MSLDRQRILNELGSVVNQLQSADCGCMGKLFSNKNENQGASMASASTINGGCRQGCCHGHGFRDGTPCAGEPYSMKQTHPCMGQCNAPKLYSDTYNYLNNNLMQPVMKEVYDDLKSINPANTVMNSPLSNQMGISQGFSGPGATVQENVSNGTVGMQNMARMESVNPNSIAMEQLRQPMNAMGGMGPQIVNMIMGDGGTKPSNAQGMPGGQLAGPTVIDAPQSPHGKIGLTPINPLGANVTQLPNMYSGTNSMMGHFSSSSEAQGTQPMSHGHNAMVSANSQNPAAHQMTPSNGQYGQHTQGVMKFNEMFPGVNQGDLGFDTMAIAIQMNPANQQKAAMDTMQKLMTGSPTNRALDSSAIKPTMNTTKSPLQSIQPSNTVNHQQNVMYASQMGNQQVPSGQKICENSEQNANQRIISGQQQIINTNNGVVCSQPNTKYNIPQQQAYSALNKSDIFNGQQIQAYQQQSYPLQQYQQSHTQYLTDPNTGATLTLPTMPAGVSDSMVDPSAQMQLPLSEETANATRTTLAHAMIKDPIFPADTSRNRPYTYPKPVKNFDYNTLGQPVEMLPAKMFHPPELSLPQTLSPQPFNKLRNDHTRFSNVKSTVSKTSLMGNNAVGRTPSRSQLQHIYNQYKGSQSYTQQNVRPYVQGATFSDGKLNVPVSNMNHPQQIPIEKIGGDTAANNQLAGNQLLIKEQSMGHNIIGDVPVPNKLQESSPKKLMSPIPARQANLRNGLQDVVYTSYPSSAAWSFHGTNTYRPIASVGYRFRNIK